MIIKSKIFILLFFLCLFLISCKNKNIEKIEKDSFLFGTNIKIVVYDENKKNSEKLIEETFVLMENIEKKYNSRNENSITYKINKNPLGAQSIDKEYHDMIYRTIELSKITEGSFDITVGPVMSLWGFDDLDIKEVPKEEKIKETLKLVNYKDIELKNDSIKLKKIGQKIDTGSFLKGFAINEGIKYLKSKGIKSAMITAISSIGTIGSKPEGKDFKIGIQNPKNSEELLYTINLNDRALGVAGDYQTFVEIDGKKYHHIIDAKTGYPSEYNSMVLIFCEDSYTADLYDTALFLLKPEEILKFVSEQKNIEVFIVDKNGKEYFSENIKKYMEISKK